MHCASRLLYSEPALHKTPDAHHCFCINVWMDSVELLRCIDSKHA